MERYTTPLGLSIQAPCTRRARSMPKCLDVPFTRPGRTEANAALRNNGLLPLEYACPADGTARIGNRSKCDFGTNLLTKAILRKEGYAEV